MKKNLLFSLAMLFGSLSGFAQNVIVNAAGLSFTPQSLTIDAGQTVEWQNTGGVHNVNGSQVAYPGNPEAFNSGAPAGAPWNFTHTFNLPGTYQYHCDPHLTAGMTGTITVLPVTPSYNIATVTTVDAEGVADSVDVFCQLQGIVYGVDLRGGNGVQFTIHDGTGGITVFHPSLNDYVVAEGDEVIVVGTINQFNGLTQILPESIELLSSSNPLPAPAVVTELNEDTESELLRINNLSLVNPAQWTGAGTGFNVDVSDGVNTYLMRIDNDVTAYSMPAPLGTFDVIGIGSQFDPSLPFTDGYQILPRYEEDIIQAPITDVIAVDDAVSGFENVALTFNVLDNDILPNGPDDIVLTIVQQPASGTLTDNGDGSYTYTPNADFCGDDSFVYEACDNSIPSCDEATVNITIECAGNYPAYDIATVTTVDADGQPDSLGVTCQIQGIVHSIDFNGGNPVQFFIQDATGGMSVFSGDNFGYEVALGDELILRGTIVAFNCLTQMEPDEIILLSSGNDLFDPQVVEQLDESTEGSLIRINSLIIVDPSQWTGAGPGFTVNVSNGSATFAMRIDNDVDLYSMMAPNGTFDAIGLGSQFSTSANCSGGYQFLPRFIEDILPVTNTDQVLLDQQIRAFPNPASDLVFLQTSLELESVRLLNLQGQQLRQYAGNTTQVDLSGLPAGVYFLQVQTELGPWVSRVVKQ